MTKANFNKPKEITKKEFLNSLKFKSSDEKQKIFDLAWDSRKFEIELLWKRAGYFWAFQALALAGFVSIISIDNQSLHYSEIEFYITCIGFTTAFAWHLINKGSKSWQRHWEKIIDVIEDDIIGELYKTSTTLKTFSVSKINILISQYFTIFWFFLIVKQIYEKYLFFKDGTFNENILFSIIITLIICINMRFGRGRGRFGNRNIKFYRRKIKTK